MVKKISSLTELTTQPHQTGKDCVQAQTLAVSCTFLLGITLLSRGCLSLILSAKWQMEKLFVIEKRIFYQTSYKWGPLNFNLPAKH